MSDAALALHPSPPAPPPADYRPRLRPLIAAGAMVRFLRNKEATIEPFRIAAALDGPQTERNFKRFASDTAGARILYERRDLYRALRDRAALAGMPENSFGRAYLAFVTAEHISADELQLAMDPRGRSVARYGEDRARFINRFGHAHDLLHVLTGYGRDFIGELCVLAFTRQFSRSRAIALINLLQGLKARRDFPGLPVGACVAEATRLGRRAEDLLCADWEALLPAPLSETRARLKVGTPARYLAVQASAAAIDRRHREALRQRDDRAPNNSPH